MDNLLWSAFSWLMTALSLAGAYIIVKVDNRKHVIGLWLWIFANTGWIIINIKAGIPAQSVLYVAYLYLTGKGLWERRGKHV